MAIPHHRWTVYSRTRKHSAKKASAYTSRSAWGGEKAGTAERPYSAIAAAAYVSRSKTWDRRYTKHQDYSRKTDHVWSGILAPDNAPSWVYDRQKLWTAVEEREDLSNRKETAQLFRGTVISLPRELTPEQRVKLVCDYIQNEYVSQGMIADINIHNPSAADGGEQPHAHVMLTMRDIGPEGFGNKRRDWNDVDFGNKDGGQHHRPRAMKDGFLNQRRRSWAEYVNQALADAGFDARIDHRQLKDQGSPLLPNVTMGKAQHADENKYEFVQRKKAKAADVRSYNSSIDLSGMVQRVVMGGMEGGVAGAVMTGLGEFAGAGLIPHIEDAVSAIPRSVIGMVERLYDQSGR